MFESVHEFSEWLAGTGLSVVLQTTSWAIPAVQTVHIVSVAAVVSATFLVSLRILGIFERSQALAALSGRFLPWVWYALVVLFVSGALLVIAEPGRSLTNPAFVLKMVMLLGAAGLTLLLQRPLQADAAFWDASSQRRALARTIAVLSLSLWSGIVFAGRWIAYVSV